MNPKFQNALKRIPQATPPIWFMRQAGRYHKHYQALRAKHSFLELCRRPELATEVALGPIEDFDFDVAILFSDILFPLDALGMGLSYSDQHGPKLATPLTGESISNLKTPEEALTELKFQGQALALTRKALPKNKSLIGFVGGLWTLYVYAVEGGHSGNLTQAKSQPQLFRNFMEILFPLIQNNIADQLANGAEVVMVFDTAAGELSPSCFHSWLEPYLLKLTERFPNKLGYYTKYVGLQYYSTNLKSAPWAGFGFDHRHEMKDLLAANKSERTPGFIQGNFDQSLLFLDPNTFQIAMSKYIERMKSLTLEQRAGWVSGLGHGVLPKTPEQHVRQFISRIREEFS